MTSNVEIGKPMQVGDKVVVLYTTDANGIYSVHEVDPRQRRQPRLGWVAVLPQEHDEALPMWGWHPNQDALPTNTSSWLRKDALTKAIKALILYKDGDPQQQRAEVAYQLQPSQCGTCGKTVLWRTDQRGKSGVYDQDEVQILTSEGTLAIGNIRHECGKALP